jgi:hypothetical protein
MRSIAGLTVLLLGVGVYIIIIVCGITVSTLWLATTLAEALP